MPIFRKVPANIERFIPVNEQTTEGVPSFSAFAQLAKQAKAAAKTNPRQKKVSLTPEAVQTYLDASIREWRAKRDGSDDPHVLELASHYIDAFQAVRTSLIGETLEAEDEIEEAWKKMSGADWKHRAQEQKAEQVADLLLNAGVTAAEAERNGKDDKKRMEVAKMLKKDSMSLETWAIAVSKMREKEAGQHAA